MVEDVQTTEITNHSDFLLLNGRRIFVKQAR
jgi:hypothetical protein